MEDRQDLQPRTPQPDQQPNAPSQHPVTAPYTDVLGIISIVLFFFFAPAGIVVGIIGLNRAKAAGANPILSTIGMWANIIGTAFYVIAVLLIFAVIASL